MSDETAQMSNTTAQQTCETQKGLLFSATAIGNLIGTYPVIVLEEKLSIRKLFTLFGMISAISTSLIPWLANFGFEFLFAMRFLEV
ncbi:unnamed protein product, partial [Brugia pahangi]|uniref:MFS domain-containing protein n=1 Tax=Brugia pahangi TaxID=6280 RepID=A0A0N4T961_BRUPA